MKRALITDVDNTLFDWVDVWYKSFSAMINKVVEISGLNQDDLYPEIGNIHQKYRTSEYAFLLEEIPQLQSLYGHELKEKMLPAITAYREARTGALKLYPKVLETLSFLSSKGILIIAYTESMSYYSNYRFRKLGLDKVIDFLYSPPDHALPDVDLTKIRKYPADQYEMRKTKHRFTPEGEVKPNPHILTTILEENRIFPEEAVYVGDSLMKDIAMAQSARVLDALALYGAAQHRDQYELLKRVTHWSASDVEREKKIMSSKTIHPTITLPTDLSPIVRLFSGAENG